MIRAAFWLSGLFYLLVGLGFYFFSASGLLGLFMVSPLWAARLAGAVLIAWAVQLFFAAVRPSGFAVAGLAAANLLVAATLVPAALRGLIAPLSSIVVVLCAVLAILAVLAIVLPREDRRRL